MKFGTLLFAAGINANSDEKQTLANVNWDALAAQRTSSSATCAGRVNWRTKFLDDSIYHMCMMDTDLYFEEYNPEGTSKFSQQKIRDIVGIYGGDSNDLVFGYPTQDCGCFPGCQDFTVANLATHKVTHFKDFCCSDWVDECVSPPNAGDALKKAIKEADEFMKTLNSSAVAKRKLTRFEKKLQRNIDTDGEVLCSGQDNHDDDHDDHDDDHERLHGGKNTIINPNAAHVISDRFWHIVDHYFRECDLVRHHFNRANRFGNALQKALRR